MVRGARHQKEIVLHQLHSRTPSIWMKHDETNHGFFQRSERHLQASFAPTPAALLGLVSAAATLSELPLPGWLASQESPDHGACVGLAGWFSVWFSGVFMDVSGAECMRVPLIGVILIAAFFCACNLEDFTDNQERENHVHCHTKNYHELP